MRYFAELYQYRDLLFWLVITEIRLRYKSPVLGLLWAIGVPLLTSLVLAVVFSRLIPVQVHGVPYFLFLITGVLPWNCLQGTLITATTSIQQNGPMVRRLNFPRQVIPCAVVGAHLINFAFALLVVLALVWGGGAFTGRFLWVLPLAVLLQMALSMGLALLVSAWQAQYRDIKYLVDVVLVLWFYVTPILYPAEVLMQVGEWTRPGVLLNPMAGIVSLYRVALLGWDQAGVLPGIGPLELLGWTAAATCGWLWMGLRVFMRRAPTLADLVQA